MSNSHTGQTLASIAREEHQGNLNAKRVINIDENGNALNFSGSVLSPLDGYGTNDIEEGATYTYIGLEDASGNWIIKRIVNASGVTRYASGSSAYSTAWTNRASQTYNTFDTEFDPVTGSLITSATTITTNLNTTGYISTDNSSTSTLTNGSTYTGTWEDVGAYNNVVVAVKTDQNGTYTVQFSPDGSNADSTLTRYYRTTDIEVPHRFTVTRRYMRVTFTNNSGSNQTYFRLQTKVGEAEQLNAPIDGTISPDFDAIATRPTDYKYEVALGRRQGATLWNKFGYNADVDVGTEVVAAFGGTFTPLTTATTLTIVSSSTDDDGDPAGTGCNSIVVYGIDANRDLQTEVVTLNGTSNVVTTSTWLGINRVAMYLCGSGQVNAGTITITATTGGSTMATMPAGEGVTQQCIFHVPRNYQFITEWLTINTLKQAAQDPVVTFKMWVFSAVSNGKQEVFRFSIDTSVENSHDAMPGLPFPISEQCVVWLEATTDKADTIVNARFSGVLVKDVDA